MHVTPLLQLALSPISCVHRPHPQYLAQTQPKRTKAAFIQERALGLKSFVRAVIVLSRNMNLNVAKIKMQAIQNLAELRHTGGNVHQWQTTAIQGIEQLLATNASNASLILHSVV